LAFIVHNILGPVSYFDCDRLTANMKITLCEELSNYTMRTGKELDSD